MAINPRTKNLDLTTRSLLWIFNIALISGVLIHGYEIIHYMDFFVKPTGSTADIMLFFFIVIALTARISLDIRSAQIK